MIVLKIVGFILGGIIALFLLCILFFFLLSLFVSSKKDYDSPSPFYRALLNGATNFCLAFLGVKVHVSGLEKLPDDKNILFVGNHVSNYDPIVSWKVLKKWQPVFISKPSNFKIPIFGKFIRRCCFMPIDRQNARNAIKTINRSAQLLGKGEVSVFVYPEGTRNKKREQTLLPFHNGVFKIAQKAEAPIAVISVVGAETVHKRVVLRRTHVYVEVLSVLSYESIKDKSTDIIGEQVRELLETKLA